MKNQSNFTGNLTRDVELRRMPNGDAVADIGIAINDGWGDKKKTYYPRITAFGKQAEQIAEHFSKSSLISVSTKYTEDEWDDKETGKPRKGAKFIVKEWEFPPGGSGKKSEGNDESSPNAPSPSPSPAPTRQTPTRRPPAPPVETTDDDDIPF